MSGGEHRAPDSTNTYAVALIAGVSTLLIWASIVGLRAYFGSTGVTLAQEREVAGQEAVREAVYAEQVAQLAPTGLEYSDEKKTRVRIPLETATTSVLEALKADPRASTVPLVGAHNVASIPAIAGRPADNAVPTQAPPPAAPTPPAEPEPAEPEPEPEPEPASQGSATDGEPTE